MMTIWWVYTVFYGDDFYGEDLFAFRGGFFAYFVFSFGSGDLLNLLAKINDDGDDNTQLLFTRNQ